MGNSKIPKIPNPGPPQAFADAKAWAHWLGKHHYESPGIWVKLYRKDSGVPTLTHEQALEEALCLGWIDGQLKPFDRKAWLRRFTPRKPKSGWSKRNREIVERLIRERRMHPAGLSQVAAAMGDGRWDRAYDKPSESEVPADFLRALAKHPKALAFFKTLNKANRYAISYRLQTAKKPETRAKRFARLLAMMKAGKKLH